MENPLLAPELQQPLETQVNTAPVSVPPADNRRNIVPILIGSILLSATVFGATGFYFGSQSRQAVSSNNSLTESVPQAAPTSPSLATASPTVPAVNATLPQGWKYVASQTKQNANECVKFALPPMQPPYVYAADSQRAPSVTEDAGSGRFWHLGGATYPNLLAKMTSQDLILQNMALFSAEMEASGYISQAVAVSCISNTKSIDNSQLILNLDTAVAAYNSTSEEKGLQAQKYIFKKTTPTSRWGRDVIDYTVDEDGAETKYTMFATPDYIYEVKHLGGSQDSFVNQTGKQIFDLLNFD